MSDEETMPLIPAPRETIEQRKERLRRIIDDQFVNNAKKPKATKRKRR